MKTPPGTSLGRGAKSLLYILLALTAIFGGKKAVESFKESVNQVLLNKIPTTHLDE